MTEVILVNTPPKFGTPWWTDNIKYMLDSVNFDCNINVVTEGKYEGVYNKLQIFDEFKDDKQYLYLDVDMVIKGPVDHLLSKDFTLIHSWFRPAFHTPLNSSIMSWKGDRSDIYDKFDSDPDYYMVKYNKGIDEFIFKEVSHQTYFDKVCDSYLWPDREKYPMADYTIWDDSDYSVTLFNGAADLMKTRTHEWYHKYLLSE